MKKLFILILLISVSLFGCTNEKIETQPEKEAQSKDKPQITYSENEKTDSIVYKNTQYGFSFALPEGWKDYSIVTDKWEGLAIGGSQGEEIAETGPMISIRHPEWTSQNPRQDIPVMIFTLNQWDLLQQEKFHIGAAPIGPSELGRNSKYVFALPARYNFAFPTGYEEVENILKSSPLETIE